MRATSSITKTLPLLIVGSNQYGRYPMSSIEQTFNMLVSDDWLVDFAGYQNVAAIVPNGQGRGIYSGTNLGQIIGVFNNGVYLINKYLAFERIGTLSTFSGDVYIAENNSKQIAICDQSFLYIYDYSGNTTPAFQKISLDFVPTYVSFQGGYFIATSPANNQWRLSSPGNGLVWPPDPSSVGGFEVEGDAPIAAVPFPGNPNELLIFGSTGGLFWTNVGAQLFPYQLITYFTIDYGCVNPATIAASDKFIVWLGANKQSGPVIMMTQGGPAVQLSNDGINYKLANLSSPKDCYGFLFKQDGHLIYQLTFYTDNLSIAFDFNTQRFFTLTDENQNYHIAKRVVYYNEKYYFVSINDGNLYELNSEYTSYNGAEIPRVRVCNTLRLPNNARFRVNNVSFDLEQGQYRPLQALDFAFSKDNGNSFSSFSRIDLAATGRRQRRINFWGQGMALNFTPQFRFYGAGRFIANNGVMGIQT